MEKVSALLALWRGIPPQRPMTRSFDVFFDLRLNKRFNSRDAADLRRNRAHYDVTVIPYDISKKIRWISSDGSGEIIILLGSIFGNL